MAKSFRVVLMTAPRGKKAEALARGLVKERLAACVNVTAAVSHYQWKGRLHRDAESLLLIKTDSSKWASLKRWVASKHPYSVPELLALRVDAGSPAYLSWLKAELK